MTTSKNDKCCDQTKPATEVRMGREVPVLKKATHCDTGTDTKCVDKKDKTNEDLDSSLV